MTEPALDWHAVLAAEVRGRAGLLFKLAHGILRNAAAAEDACQQALLRALESRDDIRDPAAVRGWLTRVVVNESLLQLRRRKTERRVLEVTGTSAAPEMAGGPSPAAAIESRESVLLALEQLPERTRLVVVLRIMQGVPGTEVKDLVGCSEAEVSRQLHAGMTQLRGLLAE